MCSQWIVALALLIGSFVSADRSVRTTTGKVRGITVEVPDGKNVEAFLGIPYAEPPLGKLRFERPIPITPWEEEYNATFLPPPCYQNYTLKFYWTPNVERMTEDCLYLNIWVPGSLQDTKPKAVFVWIYGGAFNIGSSEMDVYNGALMASRGDIIVVSLNYRVGIFGFMTTPIPEAAGNMGIYDQVLALKWIKANVAAFGGDPELITLAGESAGAMSTAILLVSPLTRGLAKRALLQSGGLIHPMTETLKDTMIHVAEQVARITGCSNNDVNMTSNPKLVVDCLKHLPPNMISEAEGIMLKIYPITASPHPGDELLPRNPRDMLIEGDFQDTELLLGCNRDEGSNFLTFVVPEYFGIYGANAPTLKKRLAGYIIKNIFLRTEQQNHDEISKFYIEGGGNRKLRNDVDDANTDYMKTAVYDSLGDYMILCPTVFQADFQSVHPKPVYFYIFSYRPSTTVNAEWMGTTHFDEVAFVFGRPLVGDKNYTEDDKIVSRRMMDRWITFTKTGNPNIDGEIEWPQYKWNNPAYLDIKVEEKVGQKPDDYRCEFWRDRYLASLDQLKAKTESYVLLEARKDIKDSLQDQNVQSAELNKAHIVIIIICFIFVKISL